MHVPKLGMVRMDCCDPLDDLLPLVNFVRQNTHGLLG
jgi:hypothetical protein